MHTKNKNGESKSCNCSAPLANTALVYSSNGTVDRSATVNSNEKGHAIHASQKHDSSTSRYSEINDMSRVREIYRQQGFSRKTVAILMASWRSSTKKQYQSFIKRWIQYCNKRKISFVQPDLDDVLQFLTELFESGLSYSSINTARGALSALGIKIEEHSIGKHPIVIRFLKGVFNTRPSTPKYTHVWDVNTVLCFLRKLSPVKYLSLKNLTLKLCMLIALTNAARIQSIHLLCVNSVKKFSSEFVFEFEGLLKQCRPGYGNPVLSVKAYPPDRRLCTYTVLKEYLSRTVLLRKHSKLFISYIKPHGEVSKNTIARWIRDVMTRSGINTDVFGAHSVRSASSSKAKINNVPVQDILQKAGWSNATTFAKFYNKPIQKEDSFVRGVLKKN